VEPQKVPPNEPGGKIRECIRRAASATNNGPL